MAVKHNCLILIDKYDKNCKLAGWGSIYNGTNPEGHRYPDLLMEVEMNYIEREDCLNTYILETLVDTKSYSKDELSQIFKQQNIPTIPERMKFCARGKMRGGDSCQVRTC